MHYQNQQRKKFKIMLQVLQIFTQILSDYTGKFLRDDLLHTLRAKHVLCLNKQHNIERSFGTSIIHFSPLPTFIGIG